MVQKCIVVHDTNMEPIPFVEEDLYRPSEEGRSLHDQTDWILRRYMNVQPPVSRANLPTPEDFCQAYERIITENKARPTYESRCAYEFIENLKATECNSLWPDHAEPPPNLKIGNAWLGAQLLDTKCKDKTGTQSQNTISGCKETSEQKETHTRERDSAASSPRRWWQPIELVASLAATLETYQEGEMKQEDKWKFCAESYIRHVQRLFDGTEVDIVECPVPWPPWPKTGPAAVSPEAAKSRHTEPKLLWARGQKTIRECRKIEAIFNDLLARYGGTFPSGWKLEDKIKHILDELYEKKREQDSQAVSVDDDAGTAAKTRPTTWAPREFLAWSKFGSLGMCHRSISTPDGADGPAILRQHIEPAAIKNENDGKENKNPFPTNPSLRRHRRGGNMGRKAARVVPVAAAKGRANSLTT